MSSSSKSAFSMSTVMKDISDALSLDRSDKKEEAYRKYLECVLRITTKLLKDLHSEGGHVTYNKDVTRLVKLGQQCMDRVASIAVDQAGSAPPQVPKTLGIAPSVSSVRVQSPPTPSAGIITSPGSSVTDSRVKKLTPMEMAVRHNQQLLAAYKARQSQSGKTRSLSASQNLALTIQRKMAENLAIAKAREDALAKKMRERQKRLEEQAARRFHTPIGLSEEEQHQRQIYTKILEFEQEEIWMIDLRKQLEASPDDVIVIYTLIEKILSCDSHPLTQQLKIYQDKTLQQIYPLVQTKTEQVNLVSVPLSKCILSNLIKFHNDQLNNFSKNVAMSKHSFKKAEESVKDVPKKDTEDCKNQDKVKNKELEEKNKNLEEESKDLEEETKDVLDKVINNQDDIEVEHEYSEKENDTVTTANETKDSENAAVNSRRVDEDLVLNQNNVDLNIKSRLADEIESESTSTETAKTNNRVSLGKDLGDATKNVKQDLETAMVKGQQLRDSLEMENRSLKSLSRHISLEYEKYNAENMDDLFDDDDDDDDDEDDNETDSALGSSLYSTVSRGSIQVPKSDISLTVSDKVNEDSNENSNFIGSKLESAENNSSTDVNANDKSETDLNDTHSKEEDSDKGNSFPQNLSLQNLESAIKQLRNEAYHRHLKNITSDILTSIEKIQVLFVIGFEQLDTAEGRDQCNVLVEKYFFKPIWKYLLILFRLASEPKEIAIAHMMTIKEGREPAEFSVRQKLCLPSNNAGDNNDYPYKAAVVELCQVVDKPTMLDKLDCLVKTSRLVLMCVDQYYEQLDKDSSEKPSIGADDLLPVLCYVVARCKLPQIVSECQSMERFIHEGYMYGEEGYCLTSFQTAINYLISEGMKAAISENS